MRALLEIIPCSDCTGSPPSGRRAEGGRLAAICGLTTDIHRDAQADNPIGAATLAAVDAAAATGAGNRAEVIAAAAPVLVAETAKNSFAVVAADAEILAGLVLEEVVGSIKQMPVVQIGEAILKLLGVG